MQEKTEKICWTGRVSGIFNRAIVTQIVNAFVALLLTRMKKWNLTIIIAKSAKRQDFWSAVILAQEFGIKSVCQIMLPNLWMRLSGTVMSALSSSIMYRCAGWLLLRENCLRMKYGKYGGEISWSLLSSCVDRCRESGRNLQGQLSRMVDSRDFIPCWRLKQLLGTERLILRGENCPPLSWARMVVFWCQGRSAWRLQQTCTKSGQRREVTTFLR